MTEPENDVSPEEAMATKVATARREAENTRSKSEGWMSSAPKVDQNTAIGFMIPTTIAGSFLGSLLIGFYLDKWLNTSPWGVFVFLILGFVVAFRETRKLMRRMEGGDKK